MCNLYRMTVTVDEMKGLFGSFDGDRTNLQAREEIYPDQTAPVLRNIDGKLTLENMTWHTGMERKAAAHHQRAQFREQFLEAAALQSRRKSACASFEVL